MEPMELKLSMQCCMAIDLSESTECSEIAAKKRDLHHPNGSHVCCSNKTKTGSISIEINQNKFGNFLTILAQFH
jgi:hypothetical protein